MARGIQFRIPRPDDIAQNQFHKRTRNAGHRCVPFLDNPQRTRQIETFAMKHFQGACRDFILNRELWKDRYPAIDDRRVLDRIDVVKFNSDTHRDAQLAKLPVDLMPYLEILCKGNQGDL